MGELLSVHVGNDQLGARRHRGALDWVEEYDTTSGIVGVGAVCWAEELDPRK